MVSYTQMLGVSERTDVGAYLHVMLFTESNSVHHYQGIAVASYLV